MLRRTGPDPRPTTLLRAGLAAVTVASGLLVRRSAPARTPPGTRRPTTGYVAVIEVSGLLDEVLVDFVETQIAEAEDSGALALVLQLNSAGAVVERRAASTTWSSRSSTRRGAGRRLGGTRRAARPWATPPSCWRPPASSACPAGAGWRSRPPCSVTSTPRRRGRGGRQGERRARPSTSAWSDNAAPTIGVFVYGEPPEYDGLPGVETADRRRRAPAASPRPGSASSRCTASCSTPWPARRWPTCCS